MAGGVAAHRWVGGFVIALCAFFAVGVFWIEHQSGYSGISTRTVPVIVSVGLGLCGLLIFFGRRSLDGAQDDGRGAESANPTQSAQGSLSALASPSEQTARSTQSAQPARYGALVWLLAGLVMTIALIGAIGFPLACVILMVCVARGYSSTRPVRDALVSLAITLPLWLVFTQLLAINLPLMPLLGL